MLNLKVEQFENLKMVLCVDLNINFELDNDLPSVFSASLRCTQK